MSFSLVFTIGITALSLLGYLLWFSQKIEPEFALGVIFAWIGCIMFFAGILNILPLAAYAITVFGILLATASLKNLKTLLKSIFTPGIVFFCVMSVFLLFAIKGSVFEGGDAYHHWGTVANVLLRYDRLPTVENFNIIFPSYPTGTASFIYFFGKMFHADSEWFIILVQSVLTLGMFTSLFAFVKDKSGYIITAVVITILMCTNEPLRFIVVDNLLAAVALCGLAVCIYYQDQLSDKFIYVLPFVIFLTSIKNSGVLFSVIIAIYYFLCIQKDQSGIVKSITLTACPFISLNLWQAHVKMLFPSGLSDSQHAMSKTRYTALFEEKTQLGLIEPVLDRFSHNVFSFENPFFCLFAATVIVILYKLIANKKLNGPLFKLSVFCFTVYSVYLVGLLGTYICSMPAAEIQISLNPIYGPYHLPSFERYHMTVIAFICGVMYIGVLHCSSRDKIDTKIINRIIALFFAIAVCFSCKPNINHLKRQNLNTENVADAIAMRTFFDDTGIPKKSSYLVIGSESNFMTYYPRYYLDPVDCKTWSVETLQKYERYINNFEYLVLWDNSPETMAYISHLLGAEITERVVHLPSYIDQVYVYD